MAQTKRLVPHFNPNVRIYDGAVPEDALPASHPERYPTSMGTLHVRVTGSGTAASEAPPMTVVAIPANECFHTRAVELALAEGRPMDLCVHFSGKGVCDFGAGCQYVHALQHDAQDTLTTSGDRTPRSQEPGGAPRDSALVDFVVPPSPLVAGRGGSFHRGAASQSASSGHSRYLHDPYGARGWRGASLSTNASASASQPRGRGTS